MFQSSLEQNISLIKNNYEKSLSNIYECLRQKEFFLKRTQNTTPVLDQNPKSFPKLINKESLRQCSPDKQKYPKTVAISNLEYKPKSSSQSFSKNTLKALEEEQKQISLQNMKMLGLNVVKINYSQKEKRKSVIEQDIAQINKNMQYFCQGSVLNLDNFDDLEDEDLMESKVLLLHKTYNSKRVNSTKKPAGQIRIRDRSVHSHLQKKKKSMRSQQNPEYQNPIYDGRIVSYRELIFKVNSTYGVFVDTERYDNEESSFKNQNKYKAWIGLGNNGMIIKQLMKRRFWWQIVEDKNCNVNFMWTQLKNNDYFAKQEPAALWFLEQKKKQKENSLSLEPEPTLRSTKKCRKKKEEEDKEDQFLFKIMSKEEILNFKRKSRNHNFKNKQYEDKKEYLGLKKITTEHQRVHNHLTHNFYLGNKKALFYNLKEYYDLTGGNLFKAIPLTFHIKKGIKDPQYKRFITYYKKRQLIIKRQEKEMESGEIVKRPMRNIWIVKPGELTNRGNGITVIDQVYELDSIMKSQKKHQNGSEKTLIVQLYIDRPFLFKKRKFDIRHFMMITQVHGVFKAYWFRQGYIRTTSYEFDVNNFEREIHLTNDAVQKYTPLYGKYESANKVSYYDFQKYLDTNYQKEKYNFDEDILPRMKEICIDAIKSSFVKISPERFKHNFEIFGLDYMIDGQFKPWLIEINTNPCLELACPLLQRLIPQMLDQALRLSLDIVYPPPCHYPNTSKHQVPESSLENLKFQLIFDQKTQGNELRTLYKKSKNNLLEQIGDISEDEVFEDNGKNIALDQVL